jgi:hypothetical protein
MDMKRLLHPRKEKWLFYLKYKGMIIKQFYVIDKI